MNENEALEYIMKRYPKQSLLWDDYMTPIKIMVVKKNG